MISRLLTRLGYEVLETGNGQEALNLWRTRSGAIDLLLADLVTGGSRNGRQLADKLRAARPDLRVVFVSGYSPEVVGRDTEFIRRRKTSYVQKLFQSRVLVETVRRCLDAS